MLESEFQNKLIQELKRMFKGCIVTKLDASHIQGIPDLLILSFCLIQRPYISKTLLTRRISPCLLYTSTRRTSPLMPGCRHQGRACPLRRARMTSNPLIVA